MPGRRRGGLEREVEKVRSALRLLDASLRGLARAAASPQVVPGVKKPATAPGRLTLSPARRRALRLHGRYLGYIRQLKPKQRAEVKAVRDKKGVEAAIKRARKLRAL